MRRAGAASLGVALLVGVLAAVFALTAAGDLPRTSSLLPLARPRAAAGPLVAAPRRSSYFLDPSGRAVCLTGSHTWNNFQDWGTSEPPPAFDYPGYIRFLQKHGHNFIRLYVWEQAAWFPGTAAKVVIAPLPYLRTGPGRALDGSPRFDLTRFNPAYFRRLRDRVAQAGASGIYVSVMLFDGWSIESKQQKTGNGWRGHPFERDNNVNGVDGDANRDGEGDEIHTLRDTTITRLQKTYLHKVVATIGDLDNVLWEISNESRPASVAWEYEMIRTLRSIERKRGKSHPIGMTAMWPDETPGNAALVRSPADWISPHDSRPSPYKSDPPAARPSDKVVLSDTDHLWGIGGSPDWVWRSFLRGLNPIFMDPYVTAIEHNLPAWPAANAGARDPGTEWEAVRYAMGYVRAVAERVDLASMRPRGALASSGYCLADPGREYLAYVPAAKDRFHRWLASRMPALAAERLTVDVSAAPGTLEAEWIDPGRGRVVPALPVTGGRKIELRAPFAGSAVIHLRARPALHTSRRG